MTYYYDTRYLLLLLLGLIIPSFSVVQGQGNTSSFLLNEMKLLFLSVVSAVFLMSSLRIQLFCCPCHSASSSPRRIELLFGRPALSIPLILSLITTLLLPLSAFWNAYLLILVMSFWSDSIHSFLFRFSHTQEHLLFLPLVQPLQDTTLQLPTLYGAIDDASSPDELV